jgi:hypothetical protein
MWRSLIFVSLTLSAAMASTDLTVKTITHIEDSSTKPTGTSAAATRVGQENLFVHGRSLRSESLDSLEPELRDFSFGKPRLVVIDRCDEGLELLINPVTRQYIRRKTSAAPPKRFGALQARLHRKSQFAAQGDPLTYASLTSETEDMGEAREMFGRRARHFITHTNRTPTGGFAQRDDVADGWFVEGVTLPRGCSSEGNRATLPGGAQADVGSERRLGLPVLVRYTTKFGNSKLDQGTRILEREVVELSEKPVDPQLFEVPKGYKRVKHFQRER